ncbi:hypothetical protein BC938DRAFT_475660 [Jimgerdemannia flammicorona]|uniref:Uncharacterized protein n=1 Tax=Jimgerdemannia flammicorona TaxID=994334 RepID=A0A433PQP5_9FUNG|nr:hypothetical protein BC938DRAFT_475660 [Jimgerdemannia flammicorona]
MIRDATDLVEFTPAPVPLSSRLKPGDEIELPTYDQGAAALAAKRSAPQGTRDPIHPRVGCPSE